MLCRCSVELPNHDPFSNYRPYREGFIVMNVRGGSLYLPHQLNESAALKAFPPGNASLMKRFTLYPPGRPPIHLGDVLARYLTIREGRQLNGLVLRFVGLNEAQLDLLNQLPEWFPAIDGNEEDAIPLEELHRL